MLVPGLLQTAGYTLALTDASPDVVDDAAADLVVKQPTAVGPSGTARTLTAGSSSTPRRGWAAFIGGVKAGAFRD
ncbi:hypothetical protein ABT282_11705 [Streptomyces sp. NPDC000927]|uniref:hypothetical protein n=1 Tax=unclassified Streptomyces TaxID=2593676 RepID=UPI00331AB1F9